MQRISESQGCFSSAVYTAYTKYTDSAKVYLGSYKSI